MKSKLLFICFLALLAMGITVNAQDNKKALPLAEKQLNERYNQQKKTIQDNFKRDMDAVNDQKNLTPAQRELRRKQIIASYEQQKRANQEAFQTEKRRLHASTKSTKEADKDAKKDMKEIEKDRKEANKDARKDMKELEKDHKEGDKRRDEEAKRMHKKNTPPGKMHHEKMPHPKSSPKGHH